MKEHFYEMALSYYNKALSTASTADEAAKAEQKIRECKRAMMPPEEDRVVKSAKNKLLYSDQFLETGEIYDDISEQIVPYPDEDEYPLSVYRIEVYQNALLIISHEDEASSQEMDALPAGTLIPLEYETDTYRYYSSGNEGENFLIFKKNKGPVPGQNPNIFRVQDERYYVLFPSATVKQKMSKSQSRESEKAEKIESDPPQPVEKQPVVFTDNWQLNLDKEGEQIGDSRKENLKAREVCWLLFRFRYTCPETFTESLCFDFKLLDPSGKLLIFPGEGTKTGYSSSSVLNAVAGGGIFNIGVGRDKPGYFEKGKYTLSLWCDNLEYYSVVIELD